ncbi:hypothetical protein IDH30_00370 [Pelagibacterales bacterium SAG-MED15]|nr:hypothetical protein [Pelagibacterales bacterium SAG-MED15]
MNKLFKIIIIAKFLLLVFVTNSYSASKTGQPSVYKVIMKKVELCTASTSVTSCEGAVVIGTGNKTVDIAAVGEGAVAAAYGDPALLPLGETYTHMRVTIDRKMTIKADITVPGVTAPCRTTTALSDSAYPDGLSGTEKYDTTPVVADDGTAAEADIYMKNDQMETCENAACSSTSDPNTVEYDQGIGSSTHQSTHAEGDTSDDHMMVYTLASPYTVALISPTVDISFGTENAIKAAEVGTDLCSFEPQEPIVTITIK